MANQYIGSSAVRETHESGRVTKSANNSMELVQRGKYADLLAAQPAKGNELVTGYVVEQSTLSRARGGMGELVVQLVEKDSSSQSVPAEANESFIEVDMAQVEKPLVTNKKLVTSDSTAEVIDEWRNSPPNRRRLFQIPAPDLSREAKADADDDWVTMDDEAIKVAQKIMKGIEAWLAFYPVVTRTSTYKARPSPANAGKIQTPPVTVSGTWVWLKTADRVVQNAKRQYQRIEQWTASDKWDTDLYEAAT